MTVLILRGDARTRLAELSADSVHCIVTSPPYWGLRDYGVEGQIGLEATPSDYVKALVGVFAAARRVLRSDGTLWLNIGDCYAAGGHGGGGSFMDVRGGEGSAAAEAWAHRKGKTGWRRQPEGMKAKDRVLLPARVALALQADGWWLRDEIVWHKPNPMPTSVTDRTTPAHEMIYMLTKSARYAYNASAIREPMSSSSVERYRYAFGGKKNEQLRGSGHRTVVVGNRDFGDGKRNKRSVWTVNVTPFKGAHFATFPPDLIVPCIKAGAPEGGTVLDPFGGAGTTGLVAQRLGRNAVLIEMNPAYADIASRRIEAESIFR